MLVKNNVIIEISINLTGEKLTCEGQVEGMGKWKFSFNLKKEAKTREEVKFMKLN